MNHIRPLPFILLLCCLLAACADDTPPPVPKANPINPLPEDQHGPRLARTISLLLEDIAIRQDLKDRLLNKFDGDYNVLLASIPAIPARLNDPLLQLAMPSLSQLTAEDWDAENEIPVVIFRPEDADLTTTEYLTAFDRGKEFQFGITTEPDRLVLVLSHNERTIVSQKNKIPSMLRGRSCLISPVLSDEHYDYYLKQDTYECLNDQAAYSQENYGDGCDRDQNDRKDQVFRARFATINIFRNAEHYLDGNPEVFFIITLGSKNPSGFSSLRKSYPSRDRSEWKDCGIFSCDTEWYDLDLPTFDWDKSLFGDLVRYDWFEEDYSKAKIELTLGLSTKVSDVSVSGGVKITLNEKDYFLDQDFVAYCDDTEGTGTTYNTGKLLFSVN